MIASDPPHLNSFTISASKERLVSGVRVPYTNLTTGVVSAPIPSPEKWGESKIIRFLSAVTGTVAAEGGSGGACLR